MTRALWPLIALTAAACTTTPAPTPDPSPETCEGIACTELGEALYKKRERPKAYALFVRGCQGQDGPACTAQGRMARSGYAQLPPREIAALFANACKLGHAAGCAELADHTLRGDGVDKDPGAALGLYERACKASNPVACVDQARLLAKGADGVPQDKKAAGELLGPLCKKGRDATSATACFVWSGLREEEAAAAALVARACDVGLPEACLDLGRRMRDARGVPANPTQAAGLMLGLCQAGVAPACSDLAAMLAAGQGVPANLSRAAVLWRLGCEGRQYDACGHLGAAYLGGDGVEADPIAALDLHALACDQGATSWCKVATALRERHKATKKPLSKVAVQTVMRQNMGALRACSERMSGFQGRVVLSVAVGEDGRATDATKASAPKGGEAMAMCLEGVARAMRFPAPLKGAMSFSYPLDFGEEL